MPTVSKQSVPKPTVPKQSLSVKPTGRETITVYAPIFREKLEKLERRGQGQSEEATRLRATLARLDRAKSPGRPQPHPKEDEAVLTAVA